MNHPLLDAALAAAARGWHVFPLVPNSKRPAVDAWEHRATIDTDRIRAAWTARAWGIGIACGPSGLLVIDLDQPKPGQTPPAQWARPGITTGHDVLADRCATAGQAWPPATYTVQTASRGTHLYYQQPAGRQLRNTSGERGGIGWLVDTRGHGGYVVAAGTSIDGRPYTTTCDHPVAELPAWLTDKLAALATQSAPVAKPARLRTGHLSVYLAAAIRNEVAHVRAAAEGGRNHALFVAARNLGYLVAGGALDETTVRDALRFAAADHIAADAYTHREAERTITSGLKAGAKRPRRIDGEAA
ncbi:MAG: DNA primase [Streptosporangiales bacterium]|nr:DNA primase [Streptosporangiales bacterium]